MTHRRTTLDFSKHEFKTYKDKYVTIYELKIPNTGMNSIQYINCCGTMSVTGDFGNWIFCREFHPSSNGNVSGGYWDEKLEISSVQKSHKYDSDKTLEKICEFEKNFETDFADELDEEIVDWIDTLKSSVDDEHEYIYHAYRDNPSNVEWESIPFGEVRHKWLDYIYDGFNEMCDRIKQQENDI